MAEAAATATLPRLARATSPAPTRPGSILPVRLGTAPVAPLKIALFSGNYNCVRDGANRALNRLIGHVLTRGHQARVYSPVVARPAFQPAGDLVPVASLPIPGRPEYRLAARLPAATAADVRAFSPDLIHVSAPDGLNAGAIRLARTLGIPVVASMHTRFETYFEYYGLGLLRRPAEAWLRRFYNRCDMVLVPNADIAAEMRAGGITAPTRIWSRGVDRAQFTPEHRSLAWRRAAGIADHEVAILFFGRLVAEKGLAMFARTMAALTARGLPVRALVVGDGPERERFARQLGDGVFTGHLDGAALGQAVASADIFVNPSLTEAFGNVTLEAMASGVPIVAANVPSTRALIETGISGLLVSPRETGAYVDAVAALVTDAERRAMLSRAGLAVAERFNWPATLDRVIAAYRTSTAAHDA